MKKETLSKKIVQAIWRDLCDRSGYDLGCLDKDTQQEIRETWEAKVLKELEHK